MTTDDQEPVVHGPSGTPQVPSPKPRWIWPLILAVAVVGILGIGSCSYVVIRNIVGGLSAEFKQVGDGVLGKLADGAYGSVWDETAPEFRQVTSRDRFDRFLKSVEDAVGKPVSWQATGFSKNSSVGPGGPKTVTVITYEVTHQHGASTATITVDKDHRLLGINFNFR